MPVYSIPHRSWLIYGTDNHTLQTQTESRNNWAPICLPNLYTHWTCVHHLEKWNRTMVPDILKEVIYERSHLRAYSELLMFKSQGLPLVQLSQTETRAMRSLSETGNKQILLWNISRNILANTAPYNSRRRFGFCSAGCSCNWKPSTYSPDWARLFGDYEGWLQQWARALRVWTLVTDLACAETIHHLFDPGCLPQPLLWPSHSLSANRSIWHCFVCCICARMPLSVWLADGQLCRITFCGVFMLWTSGLQSETY